MLDCKRESLENFLSINELFDGKMSESESPVVDDISEGAGPMDLDGLDEDFEVDQDNRIVYFSTYSGAVVYWWRYRPFS